MRYRGGRSYTEPYGSVSNHRLPRHARQGYFDALTRRIFTLLRNGSGSARLGHGQQPLADGLGLAPEVVEARQLGERVEAEDALEERRHAVANGSAGPALPTGLGDQAALDERYDGRVGRDAAHARDLRPGHRPHV